MKLLTNYLKKDSLFAACLLTSSMAFFIKGSIYLYLGSPILFGLSLLIFILMGYVITHTNKSSRRIIKIWGWLVMLWGIGRLFIEAMFMLAPVTEAHIRDQFTILGKLISLIAIICGIVLIKRSKTYKPA